jgi:aryl-alcohol dehydrogenase-like predicted oxidoreductase
MKQSVRIVGSNVTISRIGFGGARLFGGIEARVSKQLIETALSVGIRHFDTAPSYGDSESILGEVLAGVPDATIATKVGIPHAANPARNPARIVYRQMVRPILSRMPSIKTRLLRGLDRNQDSSGVVEHSQLRQELTRDVVLRSLEESLKRLKRSRLDLLLLHEPDQFEVDGKLSELFDTLQRGGIIGAFGLAYGRVADLAPAFGTVLQSRYSQELSDSTEERRVIIMHGALRFGWNSTDTTDRDATTSEYFGNILQRHSDLALIFSASSRHQIRNLAGKLLGR